MELFKADRPAKMVLLFAGLILFLQQPLNAQSAEARLTSKCIELATGDDGGVYMRDFFIRLPKATPGRDTPVVKENIRLPSNFTYRVTLCTPEEENTGIPVVDIYDGKRKILSSYDENSGKHYNSVDFVCNKFATYTFWFYFLDGQPGTASGVITHFRTSR